MHTSELDAIDLALLKALGASPRAGMLALARDMRVARNTAQAHLDRLLSTGVITGFGPEVDLRRVGYAVSAFVNLQNLPGSQPQCGRGSSGCAGSHRSVDDNGPVGSSFAGWWRATTTTLES